MPDYLWGITTFVLAASITPGPNNLMLTASGANYGFRRTIPHMAGIMVGFAVMVMAVGLGLAQVFTAYPWIQQVLKYACFAYLVYLAYRMGTATVPPKTANNLRIESVSKPLSFVQAALFQWINPKAWFMVISAISTFTASPSNALMNVSLIALIFLIVFIPCAAIWTGFGVALSHFLTGARLRVFNWCMAILMVASVIPFVLHF